MVLGTDGPGPFGGMLFEPPAGVLAGHGQFHWVEPDLPGRGGRWLLVEKEGALDEHRAALRAVSAVAGSPGEDDPAVLAGAIEWLLYDWLMAHRESERSAAIEIRSGRPADAAMIITAAASARLHRSKKVQKLGAHS